MVQLQANTVAKVDEFKILFNTVQSHEECSREVKKSVEAEWSGWRRVICD